MDKTSSNTTLDRVTKWQWFVSVLSEVWTDVNAEKQTGDEFQIVQMEFLRLLWVVSMTTEQGPSTSICSWRSKQVDLEAILFYQTTIPKLKNDTTFGFSLWSLIGVIPKSQFNWRSSGPILQHCLNRADTDFLYTNCSTHYRMKIGFKLLSATVEMKTGQISALKLSFYPCEPWFSTHAHTYTRLTLMSGILHAPLCPH